jgi:integrase
VTARARPRNDAARAKAASRKRAERDANLRSRAAARYGKGPLQDRVVSPKTLRKYIASAKSFFKWLRLNGLQLPCEVVDFDIQITRWVECIYSEGESKSLLADALSGLSHLVPALRGKLNASWRLFHTWRRTEPVKQAPPLSVSMVQCMAGAFVEQGELELAILVLLSHHCILRTCELLSVRTTDASIVTAGVLLILRETKVGQRMGVHQEVAVKDKWLVPRFRWLLSARPPGSLLLPCTPALFRKKWALARKRCGLPAAFTPYSLRRGGATSLFQQCGSFGKVAERGRWTAEKTVRCYVNRALSDLATDSGTLAWNSESGLLQLLHRLPTKG